MVVEKGEEGMEVEKGEEGTVALKAEVEVPEDQMEAVEETVADLEKEGGKVVGYLAAIEEEKAVVMEEEEIVEEKAVPTVDSVVLMVKVEKMEADDLVELQAGWVE